jgi:FtsH-binding integral membrane protein
VTSAEVGTGVGRGARWSWLRDSRVGSIWSLAFDVSWLCVFVLLGRTSHTEGLALSGFLRTGWPFWVGLLAGWRHARATSQPAALVPTALVVWPTCVAVAMVLRAVSGQGVASAFLGVAVAFVGLGLLGWRALAQLRPKSGGRVASPHGHSDSGT